MTVLLRSLRSRLLLAAGIAIFVALSVSEFLLAKLFEQHVENRVAAELQAQANQLVAGFEFDTGQIPHPTSEPADRRFSQPYSGIYWQIDTARGLRLRSPSLWDFELVLPTDQISDGAVHRHVIAGPQRTTLLAVERGLALTAPDGPLSFRVVVAVDRSEIDEAASQFRSVLWRSLIIVGSALLSAFALMLHFGLLPLRKLGAALKKVHSGERTRVDGTFPTEVQALVDSMNRLLEQQRQSLVQARERAADLAHGFKTPLSFLAAIARDLTREGNRGPAQEIEQQVEVMERHVRRELARARVAGSSVVVQRTIAVKPVADKIIAAMRRIGGNRDLAWSSEGPSDAAFEGDEADLMEMIGNLAENAAKWASSRVVLSFAIVDDRLVISVDDDGPGLPDGLATSALERGKRLDESTEGTGLGLSIVEKAVAAYDGRLELLRSPLGGLCARLTLTGAKLTAR